MSIAVQKMFAQKDNILRGVKKKLKEEGKKGVQKVKQQIPTQTEIQSKIMDKAQGTLQGQCTPATVRKKEKVYKKLKGALNKGKSVVQRSKGALNSLEGKCNKVLSISDKIDRILGILDNIASKLRDVLKVIPIGLSALSGLAANGYAIYKLGKLIDKAKGTIKAIASSIKVFKRAIQP